VKAKAILGALFSDSGTISRSQSSRAFAPSGGSVGLDGSGASSLSRMRALSIAALIAAFGALTFLAATASADSEFGEEGQASGILTSPEGIGIDQSNGDLYVGGGFAHRVAKFEGNGTPLFAWGYGIADGKEELETCTTSCLQGYETPFEPHSVFGPMIDEGGAVAVDPTGEHDVYLVDSGHSRILKFKPNGEFLFAFGGDTVAYGPDNSSNNAVQVLKVLATGGTYKLRFEYPFARAYNGGFGGTETGSLSANATAAEIETALNGLSSVNGAGVSGGKISVVETGTREFELTFEGNLAGDFLPAVQPSYFNPPAEPTLTGGEEKAEVVITNAGGAGEVCKNSNGDTCKYGGLGTENGMFRNGQHFEGRFFGSFPDRAPIIAVGSTGTVYVGDNKRVQEFNPEGQYIGQIDLPTPAEHWNFTQAIAVDNSDNVYGISEVVSQKEELEHPNSYKREIAGVQEFDSSGTLIRTLHPSGTPQTLATDGAGDVFVGTEVNGGQSTASYSIGEYNSAGTLIARIQSALIKSTQVGGIAVGNTAEKLYVSNATHVVVIDLPQAGPPTAGGENATDIQPTTATLHAVVNPHSFDTHFHFQYVDDTHFQSGGFGNPATQSTSSIDLGLVDEDSQVQAGISGLTAETIYHFRIVAESSEGTVTGPGAIFETLPPVSVRNFTTQTVGPELVTLKVELNPNGQFSPYTIRFGENNQYTGTVHGSSSGTLQVGNEFLSKEVTFSGLNPNTTYHYQLTAENGTGKVETTDQTFTTELSTAEERALESCPNTILREENSSLALPDCRAYEQVSPPTKKGYPVTGGFHSGLAPSGERASFFSLGAFTGNTGQVSYVAHRTENGWVTEAAVARPGPDEQVKAVIEFDAELNKSLFSVVPGSTAQEVEEITSPNYLQIGSEGTFVHGTPLLEPISGFKEHGNGWDDPVAQSADLSHLFLLTHLRLLPPAEDPLGDTAGESRIYEVSGGGGPSPTLKLVAEIPTGLANPGGSCQVDSSFGAFANSASSDGSTLVYDAPLEIAQSEACSGSFSEEAPNKAALFARVNGAAPIQLSKRLPAQCQSPAPCASASPADAHFYGMSPDGSRVWFTTTQPLVNADTDNTSDLYLAKLENGQVQELVMASEGDSTDPNQGENANVQGILPMPQGGQRAYFVATGVLTTHPNGQGETAAQGADNLYAYDSQTGETKFAISLCSGPEKSGSVSDTSCPAGLDAQPGPPGGTNNDDYLWHFGKSPETQAHPTPDGRFMLFQSFGRLTGDDTDSAADIYRYDLQTGQLDRISIGRRGNDANGNDDAYKAEIGHQGINNLLHEAAENGSRSISADGSVAIFNTAAPLVSRDTDLAANPGCYSNESGCDIYMWEEQGHGTCTEAGGCVSLVSSGVDSHANNAASISASGRDIVFNTPRGMVPGDTDGVRDFYDTRVNGGFHPTHPEPVCGSPERCQPEPPPPPAQPNVSTPNFVGTGNSPEKLRCAKSRHRVTRHGQVRCVPNRHKKRHRKKRHPKTSHRQAGANGGGAK
jgi:hypothetical protein